MTLAKATVTGKVHREPQNRSTNNGVEIWDLVIDLDEKGETLIRVVSFRHALTDTLNAIKKGDKVLVDGRLQVNTTKSPDGTEKKFFEIIANDLELISGSTSSSTTVDYEPAPQVESAPQVEQAKEDIVTFAETDFTDENLLNDEEVPF